ncbi:MAG: 2-oxoglutarate dehydrogenase complex dihydrolipoyllysine-residue succinyltransferase [Pseudomonadales bacterium]|nr:2-oxoglutarate dehydrogenase complex dihydrolipoyllysine-residue succinyltransferase [Pseudomonadales bacterium]MCP5331542.1 2-oxoglutarate dehydrogenase complex dihydrolipoyllysine-residue succinyltransferase [Pseudomonadales bacterium]MCP5343425.1 2-oxoglutarate dehydrogenase complex dihydrolipoyllysine-residue succinyltransferase [Pseudomonadales bacterium]
MTIEIKAPTLPESVPDGTIATWHKKAGDSVKRDELLVDIETDKVVIEVVSPADGVLQKIIKNTGDTIVSNELIAHVEAGATAAPAASAPAEEKKSEAAQSTAPATEEPLLSPAAKKIAQENNLDIDSIKGTGKNGRVTKEDVLDAVAKKSAPAAVSSDAATRIDTSSGRVEERVPMSRLRAKVAERLLQASQTTAMLTTFNEVDMAPVMALRNKYKDLFEKSHDGVRLGFMSFFVRASTEALKRFPAVNASIDGNDIVYHGYQDIGVAVSSPRGLVVPVLRNADHMGLAQIEAQIREFGLKAQDGKLGIDEMTGGTFTISNGGVFGSLLSTPILNPPQTAILGMHKIQERPVAVNGQVVIRPMMYLALSYDHRMIDGKEAVQFLVTIKELLEDPARILLEI